MNVSSRVILIELNELTASLLDRFMSAGSLPNFSRFYRESEIYLTDAEEEGENLDPWIQWVTVHTGSPLQEHAVRRLSERSRSEVTFIWDALSRAGLKVWICGSMNAEYKKGLNGFVLPDPWSEHVRPYPPGEFEGYYDFVRKNVQEHSNRGSNNNSPRDILRFLSYMLRRGLSLNTIRTGSRQILGERKGQYRWKRASLMDEVQWDVFRWYYSKFEPDFSTFFLNSTAHYQHLFWRNLEPEKFAIKPTDEEQQEFKDAILFGYRQMDRVIGRFLHLADAPVTLIFCTGLSQQPYLEKEQTGGKRHYRLRHPGVLRQHLGLMSRFTYEPVMAEQFYLSFSTDRDAKEARDLLQRFVLDYRPVFDISRVDNRLFLSCAFHEKVPAHARIDVRDGRRSIAFYEVFYPVDSIKSGYHHPEGSLWIRRQSRKHEIHRGKIPLRSVTPMILDLFGVGGLPTMQQTASLRQPSYV